MNEIIIEDKKYISTKQAAEITGYAKDYVGQLCREGRVPARLIGRSWYVLASAIEDHRFKEEPKKQDTKEVKPASKIQSTWEAPVYKSEETYFPFINKLAVPRMLDKNKKINLLERDPEEESPVKSIGAMQDAWKNWFSGPTGDEQPLVEEKPSEPEVEEAPPVEPVAHYESEEVQIAIKTLPKEQRVEREVEVHQPGATKEEYRSSRGGYGFIRGVLVLVTLVAISIGVLGSNLVKIDYSSVPGLEYVSGTYSVNK